VLATLDDTQQAAQLALSQAQLAGARSALAETEANLRQAQADLKRQQEIVARKLGTATQLDAARAAAEALARGWPASAVRSRWRRNRWACRRWRSTTP
jgi:multidrug efflux pump subunit AcrA (membrane-fusion protein)